MIVRTLLLSFLVSGVSACTTELHTVGTPAGFAEAPRPVVTQVTFTKNPATEDIDPPEYPQQLRDETGKTDPCVGRALTEEEVKEYFRLALIIWPTDYKECTPTPCRVYGDVVLKDGRNGSFVIDLGRHGRLVTSDALEISYYCKDCKSEKLFEDYDFPCTNDVDR